MTRDKTIDVDGQKLFYREAGNPGAPAVLLLHGFPTSSHMFRDLTSQLTGEHRKWQYTHGVTDDSLIAPESNTLDSALLARPGNDEIQLDLFLDYAGNVALYT